MLRMQSKNTIMNLAMGLSRHSKENEFSTTIEFLIPKINKDYV